MVVHADVPIKILEKNKPRKVREKGSLLAPKMLRTCQKADGSFDRRQSYESSSGKAVALSTGLLHVMLTGAGAVNC